MRDLIPFKHRNVCIDLLKKSFRFLTSEYMSIQFFDGKNITIHHNIQAEWQFPEVLD